MSSIHNIDPAEFVTQALEHSVKVEAAAVVIMQREGCGRRYEGERLLCDDSRVNFTSRFVCRCREDACKIITKGRAS